MIKSAAIKIIINGQDVIFANYTHADIIFEATKTLPADTLLKITSEGQRGFITNENVFVDREKAAEIAWRCGQTTNKFNSLKSSDLEQKF